MDIEITLIGVRKFTRKNDGKVFYQVDYVKHSDMRPHTDFISATEYTTMLKKLGDKHFVNCIGHRSLNDYEQVYLSDFDIK